ncbi:MAG: DUF1289 domain-containing protein [Nevskiaceae bacterium]|nr:MAG: DUF1289 domain-containing protein [Nevskiaceae bacterium]
MPGSGWRCRGRCLVVAEPEVSSPCVQLCRLDAHNVCVGCGRTLDEIAAWPQATPLRKQTIRDAAQRRRDEMRTHGSKHPTG